MKDLREVLEREFAIDLYKNYSEGHTECCNAGGDSFEYKPAFKKKVLAHALIFHLFSPFHIEAKDDISMGFLGSTLNVGTPL